jgi:hypothetical protein
VNNHEIEVNLAAEMDRAGELAVAMFRSVLEHQGGDMCCIEPIAAIRHNMAHVMMAGMLLELDCKTMGAAKLSPMEKVMGEEFVAGLITMGMKAVEKSLVVEVFGDAKPR